MAGKIPQQFIDELLNRVDIVDVVDAYVPLKKAGKNHHACCPFHDEKTPSFTVSQQKQFYHCFGCGANGSAIGFLMEYSHMGFVEAVEDLASRVGMEIPREAQTSTGNNFTVELYELMEMVTRFYATQLRKHEAANTVVEYLKGRGITGEIAAEFELGFAPPGWDSLISALGKSNDAQQRLNKIGVIIENDRGGYYDRFRNRLMFPIRDQRGRAIGLGGRVLDDSKPKYLNSPETPIFHKGQELYGLHQARKAIKDNECVYIVEGYMDVIALAQFGVRNAVASLGTAATPEHLEKLFRMTGKIIFCFDGDEAGKTAAWRGLENALPLLREGRQVHFQFLPEGEDPDTFIRKNGMDAFRDVDHLQTLSEFLFGTLEDGIDLNTPEDSALLIEKSSPLLNKIPNGAFKTILMKELGKRARYGNDVIEQHISNQVNLSKPSMQKPLYTEPNKGVEKIRWLVRCLIHQPSLAATINNLDELKEFPSPGIHFLCELIEFIQNRPNVIVSNIIEHWRDTKFETRLKELAREEEKFDEIGVTEEVFIDAINRLIKLQRQEFQNFKAKTSPSELTEEEKARFRDLQR